MARTVYSDEAIARFWARVNKDGPITRPELGPCWGWTGGVLPKGYGHLKPAGRKQVLAHRLSWMLANGSIPDGLWVLHKCDNPPCVRPDHLFLGTAKDNTEDRDRKGRGVLKKGQPSPWKPGACRGSAAPHTNFTERDVLEIIRRYRSGEASQMELSRELGVHQTTIHRIVTGKNWKHVTGDSRD